MTVKTIENIYSVYQSQLSNNLNNYIHSLDRYSQPPLPTREATEPTILQLTDQLPRLSPRANELRRSIIKSVFSSLISNLNHQETSNQQDYTLYHLLDLALAFIDHGLAAPELALGCIEEILESSTVQQAQFTFGYLESRVQRLTVDMLPDKGKGLIFLRMQNNLLRRLSKSLHTVFCGRILCFLSSVFPIAEKSGVNLRGAFNYQNITKFDQLHSLPATTTLPINNIDEIIERDSSTQETDKTTQDIKVTNPTTEEIKPNDSTRVKASKSATDKREFYTRFWSLQALLSNPPELFKSWSPEPSTAPTGTTIPTTTTNSLTPDPTSSQPSTPNLKKLKDGISKTLEVFGRMTKKELELGATHLHKSEDLDGLEQFFFPKFLTKSNLLDLEIADPYFRRQVLTQFLIILQYIRGFSPEERAKRASLPKSNRISEIHYIYQAKDEAWVLKLSGEVWKTLYATPPHGEIFAMTIQQILIRESSWIMWKAGSCTSFEKSSLDVDPFPGYKRITSNPLKFPHPVGTPALSKLWENKVTCSSIETIDPTDGVPDLKTLHLKIQHLESQLKQLHDNLPPDTDPKAETIKSQIQLLQEQKVGLSWRALRIAQGSHLQFFGKIGMPADINKLMGIIEEAKTRANVPITRPVSGMTTSPLTTPNLQSLSGEALTVMEVETMGKVTEEVEGSAEQLQRVASNDASQPDVVMLDGESIMESVGGPGLASELDGELISESLPSAAAPVPSISTDEVQSTSPASRPPSPQPIPSSVVPTVSSTHPPPLNRHHSHPQQPPSSSPSQIRSSPTQPLQIGHESHRMSDVEQVIRRMEAEANRSAVGTPTPPPTSSGPSGRHSSGGSGPGDYSRGQHQHGGLLYYHHSLPSHPLHNHNHNHNHGPRPPPNRPPSSSNSSNLNNNRDLPLLKRPVTEVIDLDAPDLGPSTDPKKSKN